MYSIYSVLANTLGIADNKFSVCNAALLTPIIFQIDWLKSVLSNKIAGKT